MIVSTEVDEEIEDFIDDFVDTRIRSIALVHHNDGLQSDFKRLRKHKARLRHRAFHRIDEKQASVRHTQHALDLSAEIGVAWSVEDVHAEHFAAVCPSSNRVGDCAVLRKNRDSALALKWIRVEQAWMFALSKFHHTRLGEHRINERRLSVVDVRDDGNVTKVQISWHRKSVRRETDNRSRTEAQKPRFSSGSD